MHIIYIVRGVYIYIYIYVYAVGIYERAARHTPDTSNITGVLPFPAG
jgi:hypothetical protein